MCPLVASALPPPRSPWVPFPREELLATAPTFWLEQPPQIASLLDARRG